MGNYKGSRRVLQGMSTSSGAVLADECSRPFMKSLRQCDVTLKPKP